ncbi:MAG: MXAN_6640 family putative metalloprotease [Ignavibacteriaceae bacterium]
MKKNILFTLLLLSVNICFSQTLTKKELDSLYNKLIYFNSVPFKLKSVQSVEGGTKYDKCGFGLVSSLVLNINRFTPQQQSDIKRILQRPVLQDSLITPDGYYKVHYDATGINKPAYDNLSLNECLALISQTLDSVYNFEIKYLGYTFPNHDQSPYDIYITNSTSGSYGYTQPEISTGNGTYSSYIVIHNNYQNFQTKGIDGARVTLAHEFYHAIQIADYIFRYDLDGFFYELSSTAMEDFVYNTINDYYNYLPYYFNNTEDAFGCSSCNGGEQEYALAIWNIFLRDRFGSNNIKRGYDILKKQWELMPQMRALEAINNSILEYGSTYRREFNEFGIWLFYTNYRAINGLYFKEAAQYPLLHILNEFGNIPATSINASTSPTSESYLRFLQKTAGNIDTLDVIVSNSDFKNGIDSIDNQFYYKLSVSYNPVSMANNYDVNLFSNNSSVWSNTVILDNNIIIRDTTNPSPPVISLDYAYPNPFFYSLNNHIEIPTAINEYKKADLNIYTISMQLVYSTSDFASPGKKGSYILRWNGLDSNGKKLPSGVYIYYTKNGSNTTSGKIVIFNK